MVTAILSTNLFTSKSRSKIHAGSIIVMSNNPEGSMRQVLERFIKGSRKGKQKLCFHKMHIKTVKLELSD